MPSLHTTTPPSPLIELNVVELIGGPMLALMAHVHTVLSSPAYLRAANSNDSSLSESQHLASDDRFFPVAIFITVSPLFISSGRATSQCQPHGDFVKAIDLVLGGAKGLQIHYVSVCSEPKWELFNLSDQPCKEFLNI